MFNEFGKIVDDLLKENTIEMLITMPEGKLEAVIESNLGNETIELYILLHALRANICKMLKDGVLDPNKIEGMLDVILDMVKGAVLEDLGMK